MDKETYEFVPCEQTTFILAGFSVMNRSDRIVFVFNNNTGGLAFVMAPENLPLQLATPYLVLDATEVPYNLVLVADGLSLYQPDTNHIISFLFPEGMFNLFQDSIKRVYEARKK